MVDIKTGTSALQSQLQAQVQGSQNRPVAKRPPQANDGQAQPSAGQNIGGRSFVPAKQNARAGELSSDAEIQAAAERVSDLGSSRREAPVGRLSAQVNGGRNVPLGQIIDIRV